jgi:hypothetical protein
LLRDLRANSDRGSAENIRKRWAHDSEKEKTMTAAGRIAGAVSLAVALAFVLGACGGGSGVSATSLGPRLLPASSLPGFNSVATLNWNNPVDLVGRGIALPEPTYPSAAVKEFQGAHLQGAAGEVFRRGNGVRGTDVVTGVAAFDSASDAAKAQSWMHGQDLQQPCFGACFFGPQVVKLAGVPGSTAVVQTVVRARSSDPANYRAEFTIGRYLYWAWFSGDSRVKTMNEFKAGIAGYYQHAKQQKS